MLDKIISLKVELSKEECYCGVQDLYDLIAKQLGFDPQRVKYDCTKICITKQVQDQIFAYYKIKNNMTIDAMITQIIFGPKANLPYDAFIVEVQNGFIIPSCPWDELVLEELWQKVVAGEAVFNARKEDFIARVILAEMAGMSIYDTIDALITKITFGGSRNLRDQLDCHDTGDVLNKGSAQEE